MYDNNLPGTSVDLKDGGLVLPPPALEGDTVLVVGTSEDGQWGVPTRLQSLSDGLSVFGDYAKGTLLKGIAEVFGGGAKNVLGMRIGKTAAAKVTLGYEVNMITFTPGLDSGDSLILKAKNDGAKYNNVTVTLDANAPKSISLLGPDGTLVKIGMDKDAGEVTDIRDLVKLINQHPVASTWVVASYQNITEDASAYGDGTTTSFYMTQAHNTLTGVAKGAKGTDVMVLKSVNETRQLSQLIPAGTFANYPLLKKPLAGRPILFLNTSTIPATVEPLVQVTDLDQLVDGTFFVYANTNIIRFGAALTSNLEIIYLYGEDYVVGAEAVLVSAANGRVDFPFPDKIPAESPLMEMKTTILPDLSSDTFTSSQIAVISDNGIDYPITIDGQAIDPAVTPWITFDGITGAMVVSMSMLTNGDHVVEYYWDNGGVETLQTDTILDPSRLYNTPDEFIWVTPEAHVVAASVMVNDGTGAVAASTVVGFMTMVNGAARLDFKKIPNGQKTVTYDVSLPNLVFEYERLPKLPTVPVGAQGNKQIVKLAGGLDGIYMRSEDKYIDLAKHYEMLEDSAGIDHIVITHVFQDEIVSVQLDDYSISDRNFAQQLGQFCHAVSSNDRFLFGHINTMLPAATDLGSIKAYVQNLVDNAAQAAGYFDETEPVPSKRADIGRYLTVCAGGAVFRNELDKSLYANGVAASHAGLVAVLPVGESSTNEVLPNAAMPLFPMSAKQMGALIKARYVFPKYNEKGETVICDAMTAAVKGDYVRLSTARAVRAAVEAIRAAADPFIGKNGADLHTKNSMNAKIEGKLDTLRDADKAYRGYEWLQFATAAQEIIGESQGELVIYPNHELRKLRVNVNLRPFKG